MARITWPGTTEGTARAAAPRRGAHAVVFPTGPRARSSPWTRIGVVVIGLFGAWVLWGASAPRGHPGLGPGPTAWWPSAAESLRADTNDTLRPVLEEPARRPTLARNGATLLAHAGVPETRSPAPRAAAEAPPPPRAAPARRPTPRVARPAPVRAPRAVAFRGERDEGTDEEIVPPPTPPSEPDTDRPASRVAAPPRPGVAYLAVGSLPWGQLYVDGQHAGNTPALSLPISAGYHRVRVSRAGFAPFDTTIAVTAGSQVRLAGITLRPCTGDSC